MAAGPGHPRGVDDPPSPGAPYFPPGTLWQRVLSSTAHARDTGALEPIDTDWTRLDDGGMRFLVRIARHVRHKHLGRPAPPGKPVVNPFLPHEPDLFVGEISDTHIALLNKYPVIDHHLLIVTRAYVEQELALTREDFDALWQCMIEYDALGFYNGGRSAGASQPHKHLQMVPLPLDEGSRGLPIEALIDAGPPGCITRLARVPFANAFVHLAGGLDQDPAAASAACAELYPRMLEACGVATDGSRTGPYNLLVTRRWLLLVPRRRDCATPFGINALGFAGALFVHDREELRLLEARRPMQVLREVAQPRR